jgi:hypothetical protein
MFGDDVTPRDSPWAVPTSIFLLNGGHDIDQFRRKIYMC